MLLKIDYCVLCIEYSFYSLLFWKYSINHVQLSIVNDSMGSSFCYSFIGLPGSFIREQITHH